MKHLNKLIELTKLKDLENIFNYLNSNEYSSNKEKGDILEYYIKYLYERLGLKVILQGGTGDKGIDLLVYGNDLLNPIKVIQIKNHKNPKNIDDVIYDLNKIKRNYNKFEKIFTYFSLNGFVKGTEEYFGNRISLESFEDLKTLILLNSNINLEFFDSFKLFNHNEYSYKKMINDLKNKNKSLIIQPTGTGKMMLIIKFLINNLKENKKSLVIAPTQIILNKIKEKYDLIANNNYYLTYSGLVNANIKDLPDISYIILDEVHRASADKWSLSVNNLIEENPKIGLLGFTATHERMDEKNYHMNIFNNEITNEITLEEAFAKNILKFPKYISALYSIKENIIELKNDIINSSSTNKEKTICKLNELEIEWEKENNIEKVLKKYLEHLTKEKDVKFIAFCKNHTELKEFKFLFMKWLVNIFDDIEIKEISSFQTTIKQKDNLDWFTKNDGKTNKIKILLSIDMLNEGFHLKNISGLFFFRNTKSNLIFKQQLGRGLSVNSKETIIFDFVDNFSLLAENNFINNINKSVQKENIFRNKIGLNETKLICKEINFIEKNYIEALEKIKMYSNSKYMIFKIKEFYKKYEVAPKNRKYNSLPNEKEYYRWILNQYKTNYINIEKEEDINFIKHLRNFNDKYFIAKEKLKNIKEFKEKYGREITYSNKEEYKIDRLLIWWMKGQKKYNYSTVKTKEDIDLIENILINVKKNKNINKNIINLKEFYKKEKRRPSKFATEENEINLFKWLVQQHCLKYQYIQHKEDKEFVKTIYSIKEDRSDIKRIIIKLREFYAKFNDTPRSYSKNKERTEKENTLYTWILRKEKDGYKHIINEEDIEFLKMLRNMQKKEA